MLFPFYHAYVATWSNQHFFAFAKVDKLLSGDINGSHQPQRIHQSVGPTLSCVTNFQFGWAFGLCVHSMGMAAEWSEDRGELEVAK